MEMRNVQPTIRRTLIIGLGGTGLLSVLHTKKTLLQYYGQNPMAVKFLVLDTTTQSMEKSLRYIHEGTEFRDVRVELQEFIYLSVNNPLRVIESSPAIQRWWPEGIPTRAVINGAGAIRALGRLAFYNHATIVMERIDSLLSSLNDMDLGRKMREGQNLKLTERPELEIYIIGSLAGGTGGGCFIDTAFLTRELTSGQVSNIYGFLILPWIFKGLPATSRVNANVYAALKELDYYQDLDYTRERPLFVFGNREVYAERPPYDIINLVDGRNEDGINVKGSGAVQGIENLCELIGISVALNVGSLGMVRNDVLDNVRSVTGIQTKEQWSGKNPHYSGFGVSALVYPMEKHYNRAYSLYSFLLIEDGIKISKGESLQIDSQQVEADVLDFTREARLRDDDNHVIDVLISPGAIDTDFILPDGWSPDDLLGLANADQRRVERSINAQLNRNLPQKKKDSLNLLRQALQTRDERQGPVYSLRFSEQFIAQMEAYREMREGEIQRMEGELRNMENKAREIEEQAQGIGVIGAISGRRKEIQEDYERSVSLILGKKVEIARRKAALEVFNPLINEAKRHIQRMSLSEVEKKLSSVREMILKDLFTTSHLPEFYGEYTLIVAPRWIWIRGPKKHYYEDFDKMLQDRGIGVSFNDFLKKKGLTFEQIVGMDEGSLKGEIVSYSQDQMRFVKDMSVEEALLSEAEEDKTGEEELKERLREASARATPLWFHGAHAERAALMEELFILGVCNEGDTKLKTNSYGVDLLPYLSTQDTRYPPNFTSTRDPYKIFFFKYKVPLPAYLLHDMENYRKEYFETLVYMTPHAEREAELKIPDLFPHTPVEERRLRAFVLAVSPPLGLIKTRLEEMGTEMINVYYVDVQRLVQHGEVVLGRTRLSAFEEFCKERKRELRDKMIDVLKEELQKEPERIKQELNDHLKRQEEKFEQEMRRLRTNSGRSTLTIGEEILMKREIDILREFVQFEGDDLRDFM